MLDLVSKRYLFFLLSALVILPGVISLILPGGIHPGIDFSAGSIMTLQFPVPVDQGELRQAFVDLGHPEAVVQRSEDVYLVRTFPLAEDQRDENGNIIHSERQDIENALRQRFVPADVLASQPDIRVVVGYDSVSPLVASEIVRKSILAVIAACIGILGYLSWAFRKVKNPWRYGVCAVAALVHDALLVLGVFSILGRLFGVELDALFITAVLTVIGFSVHDTIVVFDRIRENLQRYPGETFDTVVNHSLTQTMSRSLNTSITVLLTLVTLLLFGGVTIHTFVLALLVGIIAGTYSSIFNASMMLVVWENGEFKRLFHRGPREPEAAAAAA
ncbi:MAG TPA: protein translocase subunit SecF [Chloroflexota bacterium]|nr:protein translocase subunit SecF [Chloroflexota bacterium]